MKRSKLMLSAVLLSSAVITHAFPQLWFDEAGSSTQTNVTFTLGTLPSTYSLDLHLNTDGNAVSGLQYYFITSPANALTFGGTPLTALNDPFISADIFLQPAANATVNQAGGTTVWFKGTLPDYPASANYTNATYQFNTSALGLGTYVFTPVGEELTFGETTITTFAAPGQFVLNVIPEPGSALLMGAGFLALSLRRRRQ